MTNVQPGDRVTLTRHGWTLLFKHGLHTPWPWWQPVPAHTCTVVEQRNNGLWRLKLGNLEFVMGSDNFLTAS